MRRGAIARAARRRRRPKRAGRGRDTSSTACAGTSPSVDPLSADRARADAEDDGEGGLLGACERGDADAAKEMLRDGNECVGG